MKPMEHPYSRINLKRDTSQILYDRTVIPWGKQQQYTISSKIGRGKYAHVFLGRGVGGKEAVAIKVMLPIKKSKIKREYHMLKSLNHPNIINLLDVVKCSHTKTASFVFEHFEHTDFRELCQRVTLSDIKIYMRQLFEGLEAMHSIGIMHRDIKPLNVLMNEHTKKLKIIDLGLCEYYFPDKENNIHVGSRYYKAPQLLLENNQYDYRVDCWAAGVIFASMIFGKAPLLVGNSPIDQILKVCCLLGSQEVIAYINQYDLASGKHRFYGNISHDLKKAFEKGNIKTTHPSNFEEFITPENKERATEDAINLLKQLLTLDYKQRLTASQALEHRFLIG